ncbi:MAG TPA: NAD(P)/FAD-dependent oxidoreductase [Saprospiraceae bacterium]|nr:NAD(P)/FAD-dependent oxidoreductase [Saprospiraceae bacterium]HMP24242.1 NAD(P)/FAD-dependent oxidoreductase [Saprospiraceae bacterium]
MKRTVFLKNITLLFFGFGLIPRLTFGLSKKNTCKIGIIGAGISGLYLGKYLTKQGYSVAILEAKDSAGGRIAENTHFHSHPIDLGAQWIHGKNELYKLVKKAHTPIYQDKKNDVIKIMYDNQLNDDFPIEFYQFLNEIKRKTPLKNDMSVLDFAMKFNSDSKFIKLVESALTDTATRASNFSANEISKLTTKLKTIDYQFAHTTMYGFVHKNYIEALKDEIVYNFQVSSVDYTKKAIVVANDAGLAYEFDKLIITIPITELKSKKIRFEPDLPKAKWEAFEQIGMDKGLKLFLKFEKQFYEYSLFNGKYAGYYIDPTKVDSGGHSLLASLIMGNNADTYYDNPNKAIDNYLNELDGYFNGQASKYFIDAFAQDWGNEKYINGVYSYTKVGGQTARAVARRPITNKLYFAGEAMNTNRNYGNVHGAIESAMDVLYHLRFTKSDL